MRGVGGPLLCIGDLLSDVGDDDVLDWAHKEDAAEPSSPSSPAAGDLSLGPLRPSDLHRLFEENYSELIKSLEGNDHSWTVLTLKVCDALKTTNKLVSCANSNIESLLEKVEVLEHILKRGDNAVATAEAMQYADEGVA
ncbi:uncharacterized protein A4U43_C06F17460 [Asparagus officinalis]|uniref:Uncharacterized protein n=1 Tax=Asparagus officinalis TaxID=4686 RepID=A0A5P1EQX3_ASPOF|nr:uncharacterized protein LOC109845599 [Asparagus officinalis]ONK67199.1 uncharacterized protein A4U43_C06F17460 [Asparagus officinalis]